MVIQKLDYCSEMVGIKIIAVGLAACKAVRRSFPSTYDYAQFVFLSGDRDDGVSLHSAHGISPTAILETSADGWNWMSEILLDTDLVFIVSIPGKEEDKSLAIAAMAKDLGILTVAVVTSEDNMIGFPEHSCEPPITDNVNAWLLIPTVQSILEGSSADSHFPNMVRKSPFFTAVHAIVGLIQNFTMISFDFADARAILFEGGMSTVSFGWGTGRSRAVTSAREALNKAWMSEFDFRGLTGVIVNITAGLDFKLDDFSNVCDVIEEWLPEDSDIIVCCSAFTDLEMSDSLGVSIIMTGISALR